MYNLYEIAAHRFSVFGDINDPVALKTIMVGIYGIPIKLVKSQSNLNLTSWVMAFFDQLNT